MEDTSVITKMEVGDSPNSLDFAEETSPGTVETEQPIPKFKDPDLEAIVTQIRAMDEEKEKLDQLRTELGKMMSTRSPSSGSTSPVNQTEEQKIDADNRSIHVANVDYSATVQDLMTYFNGCGSMNKITIPCDKFSGYPKGFAYIEFADKDSVQAAIALNESMFKGRQIKVSSKRTNRPGISTTNRAPSGPYKNSSKISGFPSGKYAGYRSTYGMVNARAKTAPYHNPRHARYPTNNGFPVANRFQSTRVPPTNGFPSTRRFPPTNGLPSKRRFPPTNGFPSTRFPPSNGFPIWSHWKKPATTLVKN